MADVEIVATVDVDRAELRRRAYFIWAWECQQNCEAVAARLGEKAQTVRHWARTDGWRLRYEEERADLDPLEARPAIALRIQGGAMSAAEYLSAVAEGIIDGDKNRIAASKILLDSSGFAGMRVTGDEHSGARKAAARQATDYRSMSAEELAAAERRLRIPAHTDD